MPTNRDPFEILRHHDPVDVTTLPTADSASARALFEPITATARPDRSSVRRRRRIVALVVLAVVLAALALAVLTRDITEISVVCYSTTDLDSDRVGIRPTVAQAEAEIIGYIAGEECIPLDEAAIRIRSILDNRGLDSWAITRQPTHPDRPCTSVAFDTDSETVILVPHRDRSRGDG